MATETLSFDILARDLASPSFRNLGRAASDASGNLRGLKDQLNEVANKTARARVELDGDKEASVKLDQLTTQIIRLSGRKVDPEVDLQGYLRTRAQIDRIDLALDRLDHRHVTATVSVRQRIGESILSGLSPGGAGGGIGPLGIGGLIGGGALGAGLVPSLVGAGIGGLTGLAGVGGGLFAAGQGKTALAADKANINKQTAALKGALGDQRQQISKELKASREKFAKDQAFFAPFTGFQQALGRLERIILEPLRPIMAPLAALFKNFGDALKTLQPQITELFQASLPFTKQFLYFLLVSADTLIPAFTQVMTQMVKSGALQLMTQGLISIVKGLAAFVVALGPGMKASAEIFARVATFIGRTLGVLGTLFSVFAKVLTFDVPGAARKGTDAVIASMHAFFHDIASIFATVRHFIAASWDATWTDTKNAVRTGISDVVGFFKALPGKLLGALTGLGHSLYAFAHAALNELWDGFKAVAGSILGWLGGFAKSIISVITKILHMSPPHPGSAFYDLGVSMMRHLAAGIKSSAHHAANAAANAVGGVGGSTALGGDAAANERLARRLFPWGASQWPSFVSLVMAESGFNRFIRNPTSGAYGIPQALPESKLPFAGQAAGGSHAGPQLEWMFSYIRQVYGTPSNAWAFHLAHNWYGSGFHGWFDKPTIIGVGERGRERVDITPVHPGRGGGQKIVLQFQPGAEGQLTRALVDVLTQHVRDAGGGDVQVALGTSY